MTKKHFIKIADEIREHNQIADPEGYTTSLPFSLGQLNVLADAFAHINPQFDRSRWLGYIAGLNGPSGGNVK